MLSCIRSEVASCTWPEGGSPRSPGTSWLQCKLSCEGNCNVLLQMKFIVIINYAVWCRRRRSTLVRICSPRQRRCRPTCRNLGRRADTCRCCCSRQRCDTRHGPKEEHGLDHGLCRFLVVQYSYVSVYLTLSLALDRSFDVAQRCQGRRELDSMNKAFCQVRQCIAYIGNTGNK